MQLNRPVSQAHHLLGQPTSLAEHFDAHGPLAAPIGRHSPAKQKLMADLEASGLTGRGGGGFPTAQKVAVVQRGRRGGAVVVNAMEGEPASDKDKVLLSRTPHLVLDGAQYLAALLGADQVIVCVPASRDWIATFVQSAIDERRRSRWAHVEELMVRPPDGFVVGEESALANWIDAGVPVPVFRPDKGVPLRIARRPALIHNTETLAHIGLIGRYGSAPFQARGTPQEPGTCLVTLSGAVAQQGVVEVDRGTPLHEIVALGGPTEPLQALLVGGYGGAWIGPEYFATPYTHSALRSVGGTLGVGVIVALGQSACGIAESARIARYLASQSAGQCGPCVYGLPAVADDLARLASGHADAGLVSRLNRRLNQVKGRGACRHPDGAVAMAQSALHVFANDVALHARNRVCAHLQQASTLRFPHPVGR